MGNFIGKPGPFSNEGSYRVYRHCLQYEVKTTYPPSGSPMLRVVAAACF